MRVWRAQSTTRDGHLPDHRIDRSTRTHTPPTQTRKWQQILDRSTVHTGLRWLVFAGLMALYALRVFLLNGWFIVTYGLGIYLLNNFIGFLSPQVGGQAWFVGARESSRRGEGE